MVIDRQGRIVALPQRDGTQTTKIVGAVVPGGVVEPADLRAVLDRLLEEGQP